MLPEKSIGRLQGLKEPLVHVVEPRNSNDGSSWCSLFDVHSQLVDSEGMLLCSCKKTGADRRPFVTLFCTVQNDLLLNIYGILNDR
jgi:hypothetical protein